ncbi:MAG: hypothetical protein AAFV69_11235, partial [Pseudomonadota bacterium]
MSRLRVALLPELLVAARWSIAHGPVRVLLHPGALRGRAAKASGRLAPRAAGRSSMVYRSRACQGATAP